MSISTGDLRFKIIIQYNAKAGQTDVNGNLAHDWQTLATVWAAKSGLRFKTFYEAAERQGQNDAVYTIRYRDDIEPGMQIIDNGTTYDIYAMPVDTDGHRRWLEIHARAVVPNVG